MSSTDNGSSSEKDAILEKYNSLSVGELLKLIKLVRPRTSHNCSRETLVKMCCDNHVDILRQQTAQGSQQRVSRGKAKKASKEKAKKVNPVVDDKSSDSEEGNGTDDEDEPSLPAKKAKTVLNSSMDDEKFVTKVVNEIRNQIVDIIPKKSLFSDFTFEDKRSANEYFHWKSIGTILEKNLDRQEVDLDELQDALEIAKKRAAVLIAAEEYSWSVASRLAASHRLQQIPLLNEYASQIEEAVKQARADQTGGGQNSRKRKRGFSYASTYRNSVSSPSVAQVNHNSFTNGIVDKDICKACGGKGHYAYVCPSVKNGTSKVGDSSGYRAKSNHQQANVNKDPSIYMDLYSSVVSATKQFLLAKNDEDVVARRLSKFYNYWAQEIGASQEVLSYIAGVDMQFDEQAAERIPFKGNKLNEDNQEEMEFVRQEILEMVKSGALVQVPWRPKTISALKIVPKAGKKRFRLVVNMRRLNMVMPEPPKIKLEGLLFLFELLKQFEYMASFDLKSGYFHIAISDHLSQFFGIEFGRPILCIQSPAIWVVLVTLNFSEDHFYVCTLYQTQILHSSPCLSGRFCHDSKERSRDEKKLVDSRARIEKSRVYKGTFKRLFFSNSITTIPRISSVQQINAGVHPGRQIDQELGQNKCCDKYGSNYSEVFGEVSGAIDFFDGGLQLCEGVSEECNWIDLRLNSSQACDQLESCYSYSSTSQGRSENGAVELEELEWKEDKEVSCDADCGDGCQFARLGRSYCGDISSNQWFLDRISSISPHFDFGDVCYNQDIQAFPVRIAPKASSGSNRQYECNVRNFESKIKDAIARSIRGVVLERIDRQRDTFGSGVHKKRIKQSSRSVVSTVPSSRMDNESIVIQRILQKVRSVANDRQVCISQQQQASPIQLGGRQLFNNDELGSRDQLRVLPIQLDTESSRSNDTSKGSGVDRSTFVREGLVPEIVAIREKVEKVKNARFSSKPIRGLRTAQEHRMVSRNSAREYVFRGSLDDSRFRLLVHKVADSTFKSYQSYFKVIIDFIETFRIRDWPLTETQTVDLLIFYFKLKYFQQHFRFNKLCLI